METKSSAPGSPGEEGAGLVPEEPAAEALEEEGTPLPSRSCGAGLCRSAAGEREDGDVVVASATEAAVVEEDGTPLLPRSCGASLCRSGVGEREDGDLVVATPRRHSDSELHTPRSDGWAFCSWTRAEAAEATSSTPAEKILPPPRALPPTREIPIHLLCCRREPRPETIAEEEEEFLPIEETKTQKRASLSSEAGSQRASCSSCWAASEVTPGEDDEDDGIGSAAWCGSSRRTSAVAANTAGAASSRSTAAAPTPRRPPMALTPPGDGAYLIFSPTLGGVMCAVFSRVEVEGALAYMDLQKPVQAFKYKTKTELYRNLQGNKRNYYASCCSFVKAGRQYGGSLRIMPGNDAAPLPFALILHFFDNSVVKLTTGDPPQSSTEVDAVAAIPSASSSFDGIEKMQLESFLNAGRSPTHGGDAMQLQMG